MHMNKVEYVLQLTGSQLFDIVMYNTAKKLCSDFPGLQCDYNDKTSIRIHGELNDFWYEKYQEAMFGKKAE
ncbi:MAG: hypothetical protein IJF53_01935 [Clostridia bacterium]|nr:hypothetical protein [Clostridia bacterium]MBQ3062276.1 hypothetical protein [Clostridia bacterium]MBQ9966236.1 hypothetical protein [Clostridia bacterium]